MSDVDFWESRDDKQRKADEHALAVTLEGIAGEAPTVDPGDRVKACITVNGRRFTVFADTRLDALLELLAEVAAHRALRRIGR